MQRTVHVEPLAQFTLPLGPTVTSQSELFEQLMLHDGPHVPVQSVMSVQLSEQLDPLQPESPISHEVPAGHEQELPTQVGGGGPSSPHAAVTTSRTNDAIESSRRGAMAPPYHRQSAVPRDRFLRSDEPTAAHNRIPSSGPCDRDHLHAHDHRVPWRVPDLRSASTFAPRCAAIPAS